MTGPAPVPALIAGRYRVIRRLGGGAMGEVFEVAHPTLPRHEAVKLLSPALSTDPNFKTRFLREADVMAGLLHSNIVTVFDRGEDAEGRMWLAMELVDGTDAAQMLETRGPMPLDLVIDVAAGAGAALDYAWRTRRVTHRDVKPANIILVLDSRHRAETVKLADFGIAKAADGATELTATGLTVGTITYMSPEALEGRELDGFADQYSLGCTAFALLTGRSPFAAESKAAIMTGHLSRPVPPVTQLRGDLPPALDEVFRRVLAKNPADRFGTCGDFVDALRVAASSGTADGSHARREAHPGDQAYASTALRQSPSRHQRETSAGSTRARRGALKIGAVTAVVALVAAVATYSVWPSKDTSEAAAPRSLVDLTPTKEEATKILGTQATATYQDGFQFLSADVSSEGVTPPQCAWYLTMSALPGVPAGASEVRSANYSFKSDAGISPSASMTVARYAEEGAKRLSAVIAPSGQCGAFTVTADARAVEMKTATAGDWSASTSSQSSQRIRVDELVAPAAGRKFVVAASDGHLVVTASVLGAELSSDRLEALVTAVLDKNGGA